MFNCWLTGSKWTNWDCIKNTGELLLGYSINLDCLAWNLLIMWDICAFVAAETDIDQRCVVHTCLIITRSATFAEIAWNLMDNFQILAGKVPKVRQVFFSEKKQPTKKVSVTRNVFSRGQHVKCRTNLWTSGIVDSASFNCCRHMFWSINTSCHQR